MRDVYIVECVRTPLGKGKDDGILRHVLPVQLLGTSLSEVAKRAKLDAKFIEDVVCGCVSPINQQGGNIGRLALLQAGFPVSVPGVQINRMCGSGQQAVHFVAQAIASGDIDIGIGCGVEMMSVVKMGSDTGSLLFRKEFLDNFPYKLIHQGASAEKIAVKYDVSRKDCDDFAHNSHLKAGVARNLGFFDDQIVPIEAKQQDGTVITVTEDEGVRYPPNRPRGVVTAGNASQVEFLYSLSLFFKNERNKQCKEITSILGGEKKKITDGASAVLLASADAVKKHNLRVRARIISRVVVGSDPILMLDGVIPATKLAVEKAGLKLSDIDLFEINEAFATVPLAWQKTLNIPWEKVNVCGGACAHGHPLGATGIFFFYSFRFLSFLQLVEISPFLKFFLTTKKVLY
ncbi:hypothetical protein RFI_12042 [Reticulomyxa filosa]|uniref:Uncharacterized protein n=1 Tax=Reticulomyxa filosa TaxID=46433 RepID=X6NGR8_RETFI|nr:hypothetical protein RFI_12042 [Reticulomyxa filosa]|eukprot:ETO25103.1 hypothetical protein RFI_12042 [Reticulomyxa filosa]